MNLTKYMKEWSEWRHKYKELDLEHHHRFLTEKKRMMVGNLKGDRIEGGHEEMTI